MRPWRAGRVEADDRDSPERGCGTASGRIGGQRHADAPPPRAGREAGLRLVLDPPHLTAHNWPVPTTGAAG